MTIFCSFISLVISVQDFQTHDLRTCTHAKYLVLGGFIAGIHKLFILKVVQMQECKNNFKTRIRFSRRPTAHFPARSERVRGIPAWRGPSEQVETCLRAGARGLQVPGWWGPGPGWGVSPSEQVCPGGGHIGNSHVDMTDNITFPINLDISCLVDLEVKLSVDFNLFLTKQYHDGNNKLLVFL